MTEPVDRAKLVYFLTDYFSDEEIIMLCLVEFPTVHNDFGSGQRKSHKIADLVAYCYRQGEVERLLAVLQRERPLPFPTHFGPAAPRPATRPPVPKVRNPRQVFISHAHQDADLAQRRETNVAIELEQAGKIQFYPLEVQPCDLPPLWRGYQRTPFGGQYEAAW